MNMWLRCGRHLHFCHRNGAIYIAKLLGLTEQNRMIGIVPTALEDAKCRNALSLQSLWPPDASAIKWPFQMPKLEMPTMHNAYIRVMYLLGSTP